MCKRWLMSLKKEATVMKPTWTKINNKIKNSYLFLSRQSPRGKYIMKMYFICQFSNVLEYSVFLSDLRVTSA